MFVLDVEDSFSAAHQLRGYEGKCENLHGHNWRVKLRVRGGQLNGVGFLMDFKELKTLLKNLLERYDHKYLNDVEPFNTTNPTAELIACDLGERTIAALPAGVGFHSVTVWESERSACTWTPA